MSRASLPSILLLAACGGKHPAPIANLGGGGPICVPAAWQIDANDGGRITVAALASGPALCRGSYRERWQCRALDLRAGSLGAPVTRDAGTHARSTEVPGHEDDDAAPREASIDGFAIPPGAGMFARAPDGTWAVAVGDKIYILERGHAAPTHALDLMVDDEATSISNAPIDAIIRGDRVYINSADAGPYAYTTAFGRDGTRLGQVPLGAYGGTFSALDAHRIAGSDFALETLTILDEAGRATTIERAHPPLRCEYAVDGAAVDTMGDDDDGGLPAACRADIKAHLVPYMGVDLIATGDDFAGVLPDGGAGRLVILSHRDLAIVAERPLRFCR